MLESPTVLDRPDVVRLHIEAVELCLHPQEKSLLLSALRSALPGANGIYYYDESKTRKTFVNFDGSKFNFPSNGQDYYVTLGGRCDVPYEKYHSATQSFEKSVMAVQNMLGACAQSDSLRLSHKRRQHEMSTPTSSRRGNMQMLLKSIEERSTPTTSTPIPEFSEPIPIVQTPGSGPTMTESTVPKALHPIELQFVDLARIAAGKDTIIDAQRSEISKLNQQLIELKQKLDEKTQLLAETENELKQRDEEVTLLKDLSSEQTYMNAQLAETKRKVMELEKYKHKLIEDHNKENEENKKRISVLELTRHNNEQKIAENTNTINDLTNKLNELTDEKEKLKTKMEEDLQEATVKFSNYHDVQKEMTEEYEAMADKNMELMKEIRHLKAELNRIDENSNSANAELSLKNLDLEKTSASQKARIRELSLIVEQLTKENMESARRFEMLEMEKREVDRRMEMLKADSRAQRTKSLVGRLRY